MSEDATIDKVTKMVAPLLVDLKLDLYDIEFRGGNLRITIDTPPGSASGVNLEQISFVTRMISRDLDHDDPVPGRYTLEVSSPGLERTMRTPQHFQREIGKTVALRLRDTAQGDRRVSGILIAATESDITVQLDDAELTRRVIPLIQIDRAKTVFAWGPAAKPGKGPSVKPSSKLSSKLSSKAAFAASKKKRSTASVGSGLLPGPSDELDPPADMGHFLTSDNTTQEAS